MKPYPNEELDRMSKREIIRLYKRTVEQFNDAVPVRHGRWIAHTMSEMTGYDPALSGDDPVCSYSCSVCGEDCYVSDTGDDILSNFCPECGADMREIQREDNE